MGCSHVILKDHVTGWAHVVLQWSHDFLGSCDLGVGAVMSQGSHDMGGVCPCDVTEVTWLGVMAGGIWSKVGLGVGGHFQP